MPLNRVVGRWSFCSACDAAHNSGVFCCFGQCSNFSWLNERDLRYYIERDNDLYSLNGVVTVHNPRFKSSVTFHKKNRLCKLIISRRIFLVQPLTVESSSITFVRPDSSLSKETSEKTSLNFFYSL